MFKKFANVQILGWKSFDHKKTAKTNYGEKYKSYYLDGSPSLNVKEALEDVADVYSISKDPKDYELFVVRAVEADEPNSNGDAFPQDELLRFDPDQGQKIYRTFNLKPHHVNHQSDNPKMARGVILDSHYNKMNDEKAFVEILVAGDKTKDPLLIQNIVAGKLDKFSMGCHCDLTVCSICGHKAYNEMQFCEHIANHKMAKIAGKLAYEKCYGVIYDEISSVYDPAMEGCEAIDVLSAEKDDKEDDNIEAAIAEETEELIKGDEQLKHLGYKNKEGVIVVGGLKPNHTITITNNNREEVTKNMVKKNEGDKLQKELKKSALEAPRWIKHPEVWDECIARLEKKMGRPGYGAAVAYYKNKCNKMGLVAGEEDDVVDNDISESISISEDAPVDEDLKLELEEEKDIDIDIERDEEGNVIDKDIDVDVDKETQDEGIPVKEEPAVEKEIPVEVAPVEIPEEEIKVETQDEDVPVEEEAPPVEEEIVVETQDEVPLEEEIPEEKIEVETQEVPISEEDIVIDEDEEMMDQAIAENPEEEVVEELPVEDLEKETQTEEEKTVEEENANEDEIIDKDLEKITEEDGELELTDAEFGMQGGLLDLEAERVNDTNWIIADSKGPLYLVKLDKAFPTMQKSFSDRFASRDYGADILRAILKNGFVKTMNRINAINVVSDLAVPENIEHPEIWLEIVGEVDDAPLVPNKIQAEYDKRVEKVVKKADPATVVTDETTKVDMDVRPPKEYPAKDDVQPLIPATTVKTDVSKALDELPPTDTHHAYKNVSVEFDKKEGWKVFDGDTCLFTVTSKNATRKVGIKLLTRISKKGMHDTWKKFGEDLPKGITEDVMTDLDEDAKKYKAKDDIPKIISPAEMKKDKNQSLDELPPTTDSVVKVDAIKDEAKREALKTAEDLVETEKKAYRTKLRRGIRLAARRANYNVEENSLKAALWDALTKYADLDSDTTEIAIETAFEDAGNDYIDNVITRGEELAEYSTPAFAQLEEDMNNIKPIAVNDEEDEKKEDDEEKEASKIAKEAENGSLGLRRTEKEDKGGRTIKAAVMSYNVRK